MEQNVGRFDRILRGIAGIWLVFIAISAFRDDQREKALVTGVAGAGLLYNWRTGHCGGNAMCGVDTANES